jgi:hypothetical protein
MARTLFPFLGIPHSVSPNDLHLTPPSAIRILKKPGLKAASEFVTPQSARYTAW